MVEAGPDSFLAAKPQAMDLIGELGMESEVIGSNDHERKTFIRRHGRMVELPDGVQMLVPTKILPMAASSLVSWPTKIRMGLEWFRRPRATPERARSVAEFVAEHYGQEAVDYLAEPLLAGIYGGDPGSTQHFQRARAASSSWNENAEASRVACWPNVHGSPARAHRSFALCAVAWDLWWRPLPARW